MSCPISSRTARRRSASTGSDAGWIRAIPLRATRSRERHTDAAKAVTTTWPWILLPEAEQTLHRAIMASHVRLAWSAHSEQVRFVALSPDARWLASFNASFRFDDCTLEDSDAAE